MKGVLFAAVNDIGRHWNATRCVAGLITPGKPPSAALEYCAPGVNQAEVMQMVKLVVTLQALSVETGIVILEHVRTAPELDPIRDFITPLGTESLIAVPLMDAEEHAGILILQQAAARHWRQTDIVVLKTIADQMTLAVNNARLRNLMKTLAVTDEKSGLLKRASYIEVLLSGTRSAVQQNSPMSLLLLQCGNNALVRELSEGALEGLMQQVGQTVCGHVRQNDVAVRYDRNTIAVLLGDTNDKNAFFVIDKMRKLLSTTFIPGREEPVPITAGIAEAVLQARFDAVDIVTELINRAESALEQARQAGLGQAKSLAPTLETAAVA